MQALLFSSFRSLIPYSETQLQQNHNRSLISGIHSILSPSGSSPESGLRYSSLDLLRPDRNPACLCMSCKWESSAEGDFLEREIPRLHFRVLCQVWALLISPNMN